MNWRGRRSLPTPMSSNASDWGERTFELQISWPQFLINISFCARAKFQLMLQKPKDALEDIHKVLKWRQDDFHGLCIRADIFQELGQFEKSLLVWQRVKKLRPRCTLVRSVTWFLSGFFLICFKGQPVDWEPKEQNYFQSTKLLRCWRYQSACEGFETHLFK